MRLLRLFLYSGVVSRVPFPPSPSPHRRPAVWASTAREPISSCWQTWWTSCVPSSPANWAHHGPDSRYRFRPGYCRRPNCRYGGYRGRYRYRGPGVGMERWEDRADTRRTARAAECPVWETRRAGPAGSDAPTERTALSVVIQARVCTAGRGCIKHAVPQRTISGRACGCWA